MKFVGAKQLSDELDLDENILYSELLEVVHEELKDSSKHFVIDEENKGVYVFGVDDISMIRNGSDKEMDFKELASKFNIENQKLDWLLNLLYKRKALDEETYRYYMEIKGKPDLDVYFEPESVFVGEETSLVIDMNTKNEINQPRIIVTLPDPFEMKFESILPSKIMPGRRIDTYRITSVRHGSYEIGVKFEGDIEGRRYSQDLKVPSIKIRALPPDLMLEETPKEVSGQYNRESVVKFTIANRGRGEAKNVQIDGLLKNNYIRILSGTFVGRIAAKGKIEHPISIIPRKSGEYIFDDLRLSFEDSEGNKSAKKIPRLTLIVSTPQPELKVDIDTPIVVNPNEIFSMTIRLTNVGRGDAINIRFEIPIEPSDSRLQGAIERLIRKLGFRNVVEMFFQMQAPEVGEIKINEFPIEFKDEEGKTLSFISPAFPIQVRKIKEEIKPVVDWPFKKGAILINKYHILDKIGEGGFSKVYLAEDTVTHKKMALKALHARYINDQLLVQDFIEEAKRTLDLRPSTIVHVRDVLIEEYNDKFYPYIVMEYLPGGTLEKRIDVKNPIDVIDACNTMIDICEAVIIAHQRGIIHCDIKPSNIFYDEKTGFWKLGDFGMAEVMRKRAVIPKGGTRVYRAPESLGDAPKVTPKSDIYSLGIVFREMLTGLRRPSTDDLRRIKEKYREFDQDKIESIINIIEKMTNRDPRQRPDWKEINEVINLGSLLGPQKF